MSERKRIKNIENDNEKIVTEYAVDRISENVKGNTLQNILDDIQEKQKSMVEEKIKRIQKDIKRLKQNKWKR